MRKIKKIICMLLVAVTAVIFAACGDERLDNNENNKTEGITTTINGSEKITEITSDDEEDKKKQDIEESGDQKQYEELTLHELVDMGFKCYGFGRSADEDNGIYLIIVHLSKDEEHIDFSVESSEELYQELDEFGLLEIDQAKDFIIENFSDKKATNYDYSIKYKIYSKEDLYYYVNKGSYVRNEDLEGKTLKTLIGEGYEFYGDFNRSGYDCIIKIFDKDGREYQILLNLFEKGYQLDSFNMIEAEELLQDYTVIECYSLK